MTFVRNLESIFERCIEGFFNKKLSSGIQPVEIAKKLVKEMDKQRTVGIAHVYVPNAYSVCLGKIDYERITPYGNAIRQELSQHIVEQAKRRNYTMVGQPVVDFFVDESVEAGLLNISSQFTEPLPQDNPETDVHCNTKVFARLDNEQGCALVPTIQAQAVVMAGRDSGLTVNVGLRRVNIGRRETNELPLTDLNTSRLHAYIAFEDGQHTLHDAKSLNGTYLNGQRIISKTLHGNDEIRVGSTVIRYEVK